MSFEEDVEKVDAYFRDLFGRDGGTLYRGVRIYNAASFWKLALVHRVLVDSLLHWSVADIALDLTSEKGYKQYFSSLYLDLETRVFSSRSEYLARIFEHLANTPLKLDQKVFL